MKAVIMAIGLSLALIGTARAEVSIIDSLKKIPAMKQGVAFSLIDSKLNYLSTMTVAEWNKIALEVGYAGDSEKTCHKAVAVLSYDIANLKSFGVNVPILDLIDLRVGTYVGYGRIQMGDAPDMRGNNELDWGVSATVVQVKF